MNTPVFVLCGGRSGSTLLRFILDSHPDLACPPETNMPALCGQLATVWSLIEGAPLSGERGDEPPDIPEAAIRGVRRTMDEMVGSYLTRRGKRGYCDKSLGTARYAELLLRVYPEAKFICLYRHPMDVIASAIEACPWGLNGYGFDRYIAGTPGNMVLALARFWADNATEILQAEDRFPGSCHRVRYEELVTRPQSIADGIFAFLGVDQVPGITARCFSPERERFGPADYKIWNTTQVSADSVGRGWDIPAGMIPPSVLEQVNGLVDSLGYIRVDEKWGTAGPPADLLVSADGMTASAMSGAGAVETTRVHDLIADRLQDGFLRLGERFSRRWNPYSRESFDVVATAPRGTGPNIRWRIDLAARTVSTREDVDESAWDVVGSAATWERVLNGDTSLSVAMRRCELRYCDTGESGSVAATSRMDMIAEFLGLTSWVPLIDTRAEVGAACPQ
jgi:hypothetical protein